MLSHIRVLFSTIIISILFLGSSALATPDAGVLLPLEPAWEKAGGQWKFNQSSITDRQILIHITSSKLNTTNKKLLIKDLVKLPFVVFVGKDGTETRPN
jgi:hypothetical protein